MAMPAPPVTSGSFQSVFSPADVAKILNLLVGGSPLASVLAPYPTQRNVVAFPTARPDRPGWVPEMGQIPVIGLGDDADLCATCKLAAIIAMSNEIIFDSSVNLTAQFTDLIRDSASAELDRGLLYGAGGATAEPRGIVAAALPAAGADLAAALTAAIGGVGDNGGTVTHLAGRPSALAAARNERDAEGRMLYPAGLGAAFGVTEVPVPELKDADVLAIDTSRVWLVQREDFAADISRDHFFDRDALALRLRGRFAVAAPAVIKSLRRLVVEPARAAAKK
jgi:HK97 family phage major capsid protein